MSSGPVTIVTTVSPRRRRRPSAVLSDRRAVRSRRDEIVGYLLSFCLHLATMLALTLTFVVSAQPGKPLPLIITMTMEDRPPDEFIPLEFTVEPASGDEQPLATPLESASLPQEATVVDPTVPKLAPGGEQGDGSTAGPLPSEGAFLELPKNAVQAGSFAAWWIPDAEKYAEKVEPGQLPRIKQDYFIYIQVLVPDGMTKYSIDDLSGEIVGTDGFKQIIPQSGFRVDASGKRARLNKAERFLTVRNGVAQMAFLVKGAGRAGVRDLVLIRSRLLNEERTLTLEFQTANGAQ